MLDESTSTSTIRGHNLSLSLPYTYTLLPGSWDSCMDYDGHTSHTHTRTGYNCSCRFRMVKTDSGSEEWQLTTDNDKGPSTVIEEGANLEPSCAMGSKDKETGA